MTAPFAFRFELLMGSVDGVTPVLYGHVRRADAPHQEPA